MRHIDIQNNAHKITPLCGKSKFGDDFIYHPEDGLHDFKYLDSISCPTCKAIVEKVKSGVVLSYAKAEAQRV